MDRYDTFIPPKCLNFLIIIIIQPYILSLFADFCPHFQYEVIHGAVLRQNSV